MRAHARAFVEARVAKFAGKELSGAEAEDATDQGPLAREGSIDERRLGGEEFLALKAEQKSLRLGALT